MANTNFENHQCVHTTFLWLLCNCDVYPTLSDIIVIVMEKVFELIILVTIFSTVCSLNGDLQRKSVLYGISVLAENDTACSRQLNTLLEAADQHHRWALKGIYMLYNFRIVIIIRNCSY